MKIMLSYQTKDMFQLEYMNAFYLLAGFYLFVNAWICFQWQFINLNILKQNHVWHHQHTKSSDFEHIKMSYE